MTIPTAYGLVLLALAAYRVWKLLAEDTLLDRPRAWILNRLCGSKPDPDECHAMTLLTCPWCAGFWVCVGAWAAWLAWPDVTMWAVVPFALSAVVGAVAVAVERLAE